jgi:hypothetical protein
MILIFQIVPISKASAQYRKLLRGEKSPFDTAVAVRIDRYRLETKKFKLFKQLEDSLSIEINSLEKEVILSDSINAESQKQITILEKANARKDSVNHILNKNFNAAIQQSLKPWYKKPEGIGIIVIGTLEVLKLIFGK